MRLGLELHLETAVGGAVASRGCASSSLSGVAAQHQDQSEAKQSPLTTLVDIEPGFKMHLEKY